MWWVYALLSAAFAALTAIFAKLGVEKINSNLATGIRTLVVIVMLWAIIFARGEQKGVTALSRHTILFLGLSGIGTGLSWLFYFKAIQLGNVSQVAPIDKLSVALTIVLSAIFLNEALTIKTIVGAGLIIAGTIVLIFK
ncbi:MAG TPA: EamA family transporter [Chitinophagaceae bacterium]|jgi:transporter family protein